MAFAKRKEVVEIMRLVLQARANERAHTMHTTCFVCIQYTEPERVCACTSLHKMRSSTFEGERARQEARLESLCMQLIVQVLIARLTKPCSGLEWVASPPLRRIKYDPLRIPLLISFARLPTCHCEKWAAFYFARIYTSKIYVRMALHSNVTSTLKWVIYSLNMHKFAAWRGRDTELAQRERHFVFVVILFLRMKELLSLRNILFAITLFCKNTILHTLNTYNYINIWPPQSLKWKIIKLLTANQNCLRPGWLKRRFLFNVICGIQAFPEFFHATFPRRSFWNWC